MPPNSVSADLTAGEAPSCWRCRYFRITHLPATPYACGFMGFQSRILPCIEVLRVDGMPCQGFAAKTNADGSLRSSR